MRRYGIVTKRRRRRERARKMRSRGMALGFGIALCMLAVSPGLRAKLETWRERGNGIIGAFAGQEAKVMELTLPNIEIYALQLGVFDSAERARIEQQRLNEQGIPCVIWQRDRLRLICSAAASRDALDLNAAGKNDAYIIRDTLEELKLQISAADEDCLDAARMIMLPDEVLAALLNNEKPLSALIEQTRFLAGKALGAHPEQPLYTRLAQHLLSWCDQQEGIPKQQEQLAAAAMYALCREWRAALMQHQAQSAASTASAQRTPSTAAEVMPPA